MKKEGKLMTALLQNDIYTITELQTMMAQMFLQISW